MSCYIIAGSSSNLATTVLLPLLLKQGILVYATHNTGKDCASNVVYIDRSEGLRMVRARVVNCALWLAPTDDAATVADFAEKCPRLWCPPWPLPSI